MNRPRFLAAAAFSTILLALIPSAPGVEHFEDISVAPQALVSGDTYHGYREYRILLQNGSSKETHNVTLVFPEHSFGADNSIHRITRTVSLAPSAQAVVPIWHPPLPAEGGGSLQIEVDGDVVGSVGLPEGGAHMGRGMGRYGGSTPPATVLISRGLNFDEADRTLRMTGDTLAYSARMATGAPDAGGMRGVVPRAWTPSPSAGPPQWLELEYDSPLAADHIRVYGISRFFAGGTMTVTGVSGTNLATVVMAPTGTGGTRRGPPDPFQEYSFPVTPEPIKTVRLEFSVMSGTIAVDAVQLLGPAGSVYAASATASSELSVPTAAGMSPGSTGPGGGSPRELLRSELPVAEWSETWLSYTPYDAIALTAADLRTAPAGVQNALWRYTEAGGNLFVIGGGEFPSSWRLFPGTVVEGGKCFNSGFGHCFVFDAEKMSALKPGAVKTIMNEASSSARHWQSLPDENTANAMFPVIENVRIPVRGTVIIMLIFVLLIGPANLIVMSRLNRRTWLLWTIPAISALTCLVVFVYSLLREGITPDVRIESLTLLDQANHRATSVGTMAFYCPLTPGQGLFFSSDTEATPLLEAMSYRYPGMPRPTRAQRQIDWTQSQHLERGWVTARVPAHFHIRKSENRRERLQFENNEGKFAVVNGLSADIQYLWLADHSGRIYSAGPITAGQKVEMSASSDRASATSQHVAALLERSAFGPIENVEANPAGLLLPGTYIAGLAKDPFVESGFGPKGKSSRTKTRCIVYGLLEPAARP